MGQFENSRRLRRAAPVDSEINSGDAGPWLQPMRPTRKQVFPALFAASRICMNSSALRHVNRETATRRLTILRGHIGAGLTHCFDDLIEGNPVNPVAVQRK